MSARTSDEVHDRFRDIAEGAGRSMAAIVGEMIEAYVAQHAPDTGDRTPEAAGVSPG